MIGLQKQEGRITSTSKSSNSHPHSPLLKLLPKKKVKLDEVVHKRAPTLSDVPRLNVVVEHDEPDSGFSLDGEVIHLFSGT